MARMAAAGFWSRVRSRVHALPLVGTRSSRFVPAFLFGALAYLAFSAHAFAADPVKAEATFSSGGGFARLVIKFDEDVTSEVVTAGSILVIRFERPVDVSVDGLAEAVPGYVGAARRDPDGSAIRLSLARKATINTMTAGERLFVDFLPDSWSGPPPSLPNEVVKELAERARLAERELRQQRALAEAKKRAPVRVRALVQPTFVRFVFEMPDGVGVSSVLNEQKLKLLFSKALTFDLDDAKLSAPPNVASISQKIDGETAQVELAMVGDVDVHSIREDKNYVIDVAFQQPDKVLAPQADAARATPMRAAEKAPAVPVPAAAMPAATPAAEKPAAEIPALAENPVAAPDKSMAPVAEQPAMAEKPAAAVEPIVSAPQPQQPPPQQKSEAIAPPPVAEPVAEGAPKMAAAPQAATPPAAPVETQAKPAEAPPKKIQAAPVAASPTSTKQDAGATDVVVIRDSEGLHMTFSMPEGTPAALF